MLAAHFRTLAAYNRWANRCLYEAAARLPDSDYRINQGAFFGSLHATLNHLLVADRLWLSRITGQGEPPPSLDTILFERLADLTIAREQEDERLIAFVAGLDAPQLGRNLTYRNTKGTEYTNSLSALLAHLFNHQTHHRGQAHGILTSSGRTAPDLDLITFYRVSR